MDCDLLLSWMTHIGEGSWTRFRNAVGELSERDGDVSNLCRRLRISLSDLGFADFFIEDTQQWKILPPLLGGLVAQENVAALCGSRTPDLIDSLKTLAESHGCRINVETIPDCPTLIYVAGSLEKLREVADQIEVSFEPNLSAILAQKLTPISMRLDNATQELAPLNWKTRSFDFRTRTWVEKLLPNSACEYTPTHGRPKYFYRKQDKLLRISKRESLYAAAMLKRVKLLEYDPAVNRLQVPLFAPLPESYSRLACLCSGRPAVVADGRITYGGVPPDIAAVLMVAAGQPHPGLELVARAGR